MEVVERIYRKFGVGECIGKGFVSRFCSILIFGNFFFYYFFSIGDYYLFFWGLYYGRC